MVNGWISLILHPGKLLKFTVGRYLLHDMCSYLREYVNLSLVKLESRYGIGCGFYLLIVFLQILFLVNSCVKVDARQ